jgi:hypothetical protein
MTDDIAELDKVNAEIAFLLNDGWNKAIIMGFRDGYSGKPDRFFDIPSRFATYYDDGFREGTEKAQKEFIENLTKTDKPI